MNSLQKPVIGLALGSGSARGWSHIGVIETLAESGIQPDIVCGTSIGALVGAAYATGRLAPLKQWLDTLTLQGVASFFDFSLNGGVIKGAKLIDFFREHFEDQDIATLTPRFGAVATDLASGRELWLQSGPVLEAVHASIALPGLFTPVRRDGRWLVDGGLVNPVPVSLCRAMGAEIVIAVDLNADLLGRHLRQRTRRTTAPAAPADDASDMAGNLRRQLQESLSHLPLPWREESAEERPPSLFATLATSINIMQVHISRSRLAGEPPDVLITPRLADLGLLEFHRAREAIEEGRKAAHAAQPMLRALGLA